MIENEELGLKVAESREEDVWERFREVAELNIKKAEEDLIIFNGMLETAKHKLGYGLLDDSKTKEAKNL